MIQWLVNNDFTDLIEKISSIYKDNSGVDITFKQPQQSQLVITLTAPHNTIIQTITLNNGELIVSREDDMYSSTMMVEKNTTEDLIVKDIKKYLLFFDAYTDKKTPSHYSRLVNKMKFYRNS